MSKAVKADETKEEEAEIPDEWTALANTYTATFVPAFATIYEAVFELLTKDSSEKILDFGCGPGEPCLTLAQRMPSSAVKLVGVDSTPLMLDIAKKRLQERQLTNHVSFHHVRRDVTMEI